MDFDTVYSLVVIFVCFILVVGIVGFVLVSNKRNKKKAQDQYGKDLIYSSSANHFSNIAYDGGILVLTTNKLIFTPQKMNLNTYELVWPITEITAVRARQVGGIISTGIAVTTAKGHEELFAVKNQQEWVTKLNDVISSNKSKQSDLINTQA